MRSSAILFVAALCLASPWASGGAHAGDLAEILQRGHIRVAVYNGLPPFSDNGRGIDLDVAAALAQRLGVALAPLWFDADENMEDDLRNMVWKGHYLGVGPADAMMHVPVDRDYAAVNRRVRFLAPYFRERFAVARDRRRIPHLEGLEVFASERIGVELDTWPDSVMLAAEGGRYRENVVHFRTATDAVAALKAGGVSAVFARSSELQPGLRGVADFEISPAPLAQGAARQWTIGIAVKAGHEALARALQQGMDGLLADGTLARIFARHGVEHVAP